MLIILSQYMDIWEAVKKTKHTLSIEKLFCAHLKTEHYGYELYDLAAVQLLKALGIYCTMHCNPRTFLPLPAVTDQTSEDGRLLPFWQVKLHSLCANITLYILIHAYQFTNASSVFSTFRTQQWGFLYIIFNILFKLSYSSFPLIKCWFIHSCILLFLQKAIYKKYKKKFVYIICIQTNVHMYIHTHIYIYCIYSHGQKYPHPW